MTVVTVVTVVTVATVVTVVTVMTVMTVVTNKLFHKKTFFFHKKKITKFFKNLKKSPKKAKCDKAQKLKILQLKTQNVTTQKLKL